MGKIEHSIFDEFTGLFLSFTEGIKDATITVKNQNGTVINNNPSTILPNGNSALIVTITKGTEKKYYGVKFVEVTGEFYGKIIVKGKNEKGAIIYTREVDVTEVGNHVVEANIVHDYDLISESPQTVTLSKKTPEKTIYFNYRSNGQGQDSNGYILEFATAPVEMLTRFTFSNEEGYDTVESVTLGIQHTGVAFVNLAWEPRMSGSKVIGITVRASSAPSGAKLSMQAVCYVGGD